MRGVHPDADRQLGTDHASLAYGVPAAARATIFVLSVGGGMSVGPKEGRTLLFGRNRPDVHVCVGEDDPRVSREHGVLEHRGGKWWIRNTGRLPGGRLLFAEEEPVPLAEGYTPVFVRGSTNREHLLEVFVTGAGGRRPAARHRAAAAALAPRRRRTPCPHRARSALPPPGSGAVGRHLKHVGDRVTGCG